MHHGGVEVGLDVVDADVGESPAQGEGFGGVEAYE